MEYFSQFWNLIADTIVGGTTYTVAWFQGIGNAVAGALGTVFLYPLKIIVEFGLALGWIVSAIGTLITLLLAPLIYIGVYFSGISGAMTTTPTSTPQILIPTQYVNFFVLNIPNWNLIGAVIGGLILIGAVIATIKSINL